MEIRVQSLHFDADKKLVDFIEKKLSKLETFYDGIISAEVILKLEPSGQIQDKLAEIRLSVPGTILISKDKEKSFEAAIDANSESLRRQLIKYKEKRIQYN